MSQAEHATDLATGGYQLALLYRARGCAARRLGALLSLLFPKG